MTPKFIYTGIRFPLIYPTDHRIVVSYFESFADHQPKRNNRRSKRKVFMYETMTDDSWNHFTETMDDIFYQLDLHYLYSLPQSQKNLNRIWTNVRDVILESAHLHIETKLIGGPSTK